MKTLIKAIVGIVIGIIVSYIFYVVARHLFVMATLFLEELGISDSRLMPEDFRNMFIK